MIEPPLPTIPNTKDRRSKTAWLAAGAFLVGVLGTAAAMTTLGRSATSGPAATAPASPPAHDEHDNPHEAGEESEASRVSLSPEAVTAAGIRIGTVQTRLRQKTLTVPGTVEASGTGVAKITPPVPGKLVRVLISLGQAVRAGQPVAVLDSYEVAQAHAAERRAEAEVRQAQAAVQTAEAEVEQARGRQKSAEKAVVTQQQLAKAGAFSQAPLQTAQADVSEAQSELITVQTELQSHQAAYGRTERLFKEGIVSRAEMEQAQLELTQDKTRLERAKARVDIARQTLTRERRVAEGGLLNRQAIQTAEAEVRAAAGEVTRARRLLDAAQTALSGARGAVEAARATLAALEGAGGHAEGEGGRVTLFAPIDGLVSAVNATLGESVERSGTLFQIDNLGTVVVQASVPEKDVARVRVGQRAEVTVASYPGRRFTGTVQSLASRVDEKTRALPVRCLVANPERRLRPEMFAQIRLSAGENRRTVVVPETALVTEGSDRESYAVFVAAADTNAYERRPVEIGDISEGHAEITRGLKAGERVVVAGAFTLQSELRKAELSEEGHAH